MKSEPQSAYATAMAIRDALLIEREQIGFDLSTVALSYETYVLMAREKLDRLHADWRECSDRVDSVMR